jgi:hypothetical protein
LPGFPASEKGFHAKSTLRLGMRRRRVQLKSAVHTWLRGGVEPPPRHEPAFRPIPAQRRPIRTEEY